MQHSLVHASIKKTPFISHQRRFQHETEFNPTAVLKALLSTAGSLKCYILKAFELNWKDSHHRGKRNNVRMGPLPLTSEDVIYLLPADSRCWCPRRDELGLWLQNKHWGILTLLPYGNQFWSVLFFFFFSSPMFSRQKKATPPSLNLKHIFFVATTLIPPHPLSNWKCCCWLECCCCKCNSPGDWVL